MLASLREMDTCYCSQTQKKVSWFQTFSLQILHYYLHEKKRGSLLARRLKALQVEKSQTLSVVLIQFFLPCQELREYSRAFD